MNLSIEPGRNAYRLSTAEASGLLVDARNYYRAFVHAAARARSYVLLAGWQFDTRVALLRGDDPMPCDAPRELAGFLRHLVVRNPDLRIYVLAWDFSVVFALEREWMTASKFENGGGDRIRFVFDAHPVPNASHHQKLVIVDGAIAFSGGIDLCESRWDDRAHACEDPLRIDCDGTPIKPFHDLQVSLLGPVVADLVDVFRTRWKVATGEALELPAPRPADEGDRDAVATGCPLPIACSRVILGRTNSDHRVGAPCQEIAELFVDAIESADQLVYAETQYFTSRRIAAAFGRRLRQRDRPKLTVVIVMPEDADTAKEKLALGTAQHEVLASLRTLARAEGHAWFVVSPEARTRTQRKPVFIHSKLLLVDDRFLSVGSANLTNRSMGVDSELALTWVCEGEDEALAGSIRAVRASLLAEHAGTDDVARFADPSHLALVIARELADPGSRLGPRPIDTNATSTLLTKLADPHVPTDPLDVIAAEAFGEPTSESVNLGLGGRWPWLGRTP